MPLLLRASRLHEGLPYPLGATWDGLGVNFALFSANATRVDLCLFDDEGRHEIETIVLPEYTDEVWHGYLPDARPGTVYAFRVHGPYDPANGHRFNARKLLLDPYAKAHVGALEWRPEIFGYTLGSGADADLVPDHRDSAPFMPKCRVVDPSFTWGRDQRPRVPWSQTVFYELHAKGFTKRHPAVPDALRGTFGGLATKNVVEYLRALGITSVELLPVHTFVDDSHLHDKALTNYWGYNTIGFFAPHPAYSSGTAGGHSEFKAMVAHLHDAGIEVILDVVYNHTAEGNELGPTLSFKGIDNASYYRLLPERKRYYINDTGTGNTLNLSHPRVLQMVTDSLRYWATEMHVDGFRFDLATILGREAYGFDEGNGFLDSCRQDPILSDLKLVAEPWDCGPGGYQVGGFPPGWAEWNDRFRDTVRGFWKGDEAPAELARRLSASADKFNRRGRKSWASVNFVTAHDGFTLADLVTYNHKHNAANDENNQDGHSNNLSWNCGVEGPTDDPHVVALRRRQMRNMLATLLLAQGTPMLTAGDEFGRTQRGNNNAYCQDNDLSWVDWEHATANRDQTAFAARLLAIRREYKVLTRARFLTGDPDGETGVRDVTWLNADGREMRGADWDNGNIRCFGMLIDGRAPATGIRRPAVDATLLIVLNGHHDVVEAVLPAWADGTGWELVLDTTDPALGGERHPTGAVYQLTGRSLALFRLLP